MEIIAGYRKELNWSIKTEWDKENEFLSYEDIPKAFSEILMIPLYQYRYDKYCGCNRTHFKYHIPVLIRKEDKERIGDIEAYLVKPETLPDNLILKALDGMKVTYDSRFTGKYVEIMLHKISPNYRSILYNEDTEFSGHMYVRDGHLYAKEFKDVKFF